VRSLRSRLILGTLIGITLCLALNGTLIFASVRSRRYSDLDRSLETMVHAMVPFAMLSAARNGRDRARTPREDHPGDRPGPTAAIGQPGTFFQCWLEDGETLMKSEELGERELAPFSTQQRVVTFASVELPGGAEGRAASLRVRPDRNRFGRERMRRRGDGRPPRGNRQPLDGRSPGGERPDRPDRPDHEGATTQDDERATPMPAIDLVVARDTTELEADLEELRWMLVLGWLTSSLGCALILMWVVGRSLRPIDGLRRQLETLDEGHLDHRFEVANTPLELVPVVDQLNALIGRLGAAFTREQTLTAHAAHELRTPLTGLRSTLEVCLKRPRGSEEYREAARDCLEITLMMQSMIERLLELNRRGEPRLERAPLGELVDEAWDAYAERADERGLELAKHFPEQLELVTDLEDLSRVLANLLENAINYADEGSTIDVSAASGPDGLRIVVTNEASSAPEDVAEHAFDVFWRADVSRSDVGVHAGLGLSLCKRIVEALGGQVEASLHEGRFALTVVLPAAPTP